MHNHTDVRDIPQTIPEALSRFRDSEHVALICAEEELSYRELLSDAEHIAHALMERGVQKGDRVVLEMSRSADYVRMYLGVIYAGAIQVTPHSDWPEHQRTLMLADCTPVLVVDDALAAELKATPLTGAVDPLPELSGSDPFQIIYTSGSTDVPKGVITCHLLLVSKYLSGENPTEESASFWFIKQNCRCMLMDANLAYVATTIQFFLAILNGKTVALATDEELNTPDRLAAFIHRTHADAIAGIPSRYGRYLADPSFAHSFSAIRFISFGGERADAKVMQALVNSTDAEIRYAYGSSESLWVTDIPYRVGEELLYEAKNSPIHLLEQEGLEEAPAGTVGEICVGGVVGRLGSYWNDRRLTAAKYIDHPRYGTLFRTGDLARREPDGRLRILGRLDGMSKLHGIRIETAAIEDAMESFPGILRAAVKIQGEGAEAVLCGYYSGTVDEGALRRSLSETLPYYMVPAFLRELPELPLNLNGKLDRNALPVVQLRKGTYVPPRTKEEALLCEAFAHVLRRKTPVGINDSFFELGGDSIRGLETVALVRERGFLLKLEWLFAVPTVRSLSSMLLPLEAASAREEPLWSVEPSEEEWKGIDSVVGRGNVEAVYPVILTAGQYARRRDPCWVVEMLRLSGDCTEEELRRRTAASVRCHQAMRSIFLNQGTDHPLQVVLKEWEIPVSCVDLRRMAAPGGEALSAEQLPYLQTLERLYRSQPFSSDKVMFDLVLVRISDDFSVLVLAYSHLLLDGVGKAQIWKELAGGAQAVSDVRQYNNYLRRILNASPREGDNQPGFDASRLTSLTPVPGGEAGRCLRLFIAGEVFVRQLTRFLLTWQVTASAVVSLALGRVLMSLCSVKKAAFLSMNSGRDAEHAQLTGMFAAQFPLTVEETDTVISMQEQLLRAGGHPVPALQAHRSERGEHPVILSMQTFPRIDGVQTIDIPLIREEAMPELRRHSENSVIPSNELSVIISPEPPFWILVRYDGKFYDQSLADVIGQRLLIELRRIVNDEGNG